MASIFKSRSIARLSAVQALYQLEQIDTTPEAVIEEFSSHRFPRLKNPVEGALFERLVKGVSENFPMLDPLIEQILNESWTLDRLDAVLRAILRAGFFELRFEQTTPHPIIINDYVDVAKEFFEGREPAFINGALDKGAKLLRKTSSQ